LNDWKETWKALVAANESWMFKTSQCHSDLYSQIMQLSLMKLVQLKADFGAIPEWSIPNIKRLDGKMYYKVSVMVKITPVRLHEIGVCTRR
jgi:hypothetical protein